MKKALFSEEEKMFLVRNAFPKSTIQASIAELNDCIIYGAGNAGQVLQHVMMHHGVRPAWFVDDNPSLWGTEYHSTPILPPDSLTKAHGKIVVIASSYFLRMQLKCQQAAVSNWMLYSEIPGADHIFPVTTQPSMMIGQIDSASLENLQLTLSHDLESHQTLKHVLLAKITGQEIPFQSNHYFVNDLIPERFYRHFVDCGAFTGDTLLEWRNRYVDHWTDKNYSYYAIEPEPNNYAKLSQTRDEFEPDIRNRIHLFPYAVGSNDDTSYVISTFGQSSSIQSGNASGSSIAVKRISTLLKHRPVSAIKMDLESFEPEALEGARELILEQRPALLISIYHRSNHLWEIPQWIEKLNAGYKIFIRQHSPTFHETVCYAYPQY